MKYFDDFVSTSFRWNGLPLLLPQQLPIISNTIKTKMNFDNPQKILNMNKVCFIVSLFFSFASYSQKKDTAIATKFFFESGFNSTKVSVMSFKETLLSKKLSTDYKIGYAFILKLPNKHYRTLTIRAGKLIKKLQLNTGKFYIISIRNNELIIDEVDEEPMYR
jgi:hypothetical protein